MDKQRIIPQMNEEHQLELMNNTMDKQRIITQMNEEHQLELMDYIVVYGHENVSNFNPTSVKIIDIDEECLTLTYKTEAGAIKNLAIVWNETEDGQDLKVNKLSDVKAKLIAMAKYAAAKQGYSFSSELLSERNCSSHLETCTCD